MPEREMPGISAKHCATPTASAPFQLSWSSLPIELAADPVAEIEHEPVDDEKNRGDRRRCEGVADDLAEHRADQHRRDRRQDDIEEHATIRRGARARQPQERQGEIEPVAPKVDEERDRCAQVHDDKICEPVRRPEVDFPVQEARQDNRMAEAADRKKLRHALQHGHDDRLDCGHRRTSPIMKTLRRTAAIMGRLMRRLPRAMPFAAFSRSRARTCGPNRSCP